MRYPKRGKNADFDKIMEKFRRLNKPNRTPVEEQEFRFYNQAFLEFMARFDPEGFAKEFREYNVTSEEFKKITGKSPEEFAKKN